MSETETNQRYYQWGMAAAIPGLQHAIDTLQAELDNIRIQLHAFMGKAESARAAIDVVRVTAEAAPVVVEFKHRQLKAPAKAKRAKASMKGYWASMTPEERSQEMQRRMKVRGKAKPQVKLQGEPKLTFAERLKLHPRDVRSPRHDDWVKKVAKAQRARFENMSVREKKAWQAAMQAGRGEHVNGAATL